MNELEAKQKVVDAGIRLVSSGLIARTWGNVSCRISDTRFVITPSGRDYLSLTADDIVTVAISDCSYSGEVKPSSEKGIHAEVYSHCPDVHFVIHTHQENASAVSALGLDAMPTDKTTYPLLGGEVPVASYGLPGTKKLRAGVGAALKQTSGQAVILRSHGVVCFGKNHKEAFQVAMDLEKASMDFIKLQYQKVAFADRYDEKKMIAFALSKLSSPWKGVRYHFPEPYLDSKRVDGGFILCPDSEHPVQVKFGRLNDAFPQEVALHNEIYQRRKEINVIHHSEALYIMAMSRANRVLRPLVDDFAQIIGTKVDPVAKGPLPLAASLKRSSAVFVGDNGAFCCGSTVGDVAAVEMILEKCCKAQIWGALFEGAKPLSRVDSKLMRFIYLKKYSKQIDQGVDS